MQSNVFDANSVWIVFWSFESVSTSTLLVASSCNKTQHMPQTKETRDSVRTKTIIWLFLTRALHNARSCFSPALKFDPSSLIVESKLNFASAAASCDPSFGNNHVRCSADINSASVRVPWGSLEMIYVMIKIGRWGWTKRTGYLLVYRGTIQNLAGRQLNAFLEHQVPFLGCFGRRFLFCRTVTR